MARKPAASDQPPQTAKSKDAAPFCHALANHLTYSVGKDHFTATPRDWFFALAHVTRDQLTGRWMETMRRYYRADAKRIYYLSMEFLIGRSLTNSLLNIGYLDRCHQAALDAGLDLDRKSVV